MDGFFLAVLQLAFVGIVYYAAYRHGFRASQEKAAAIVNQFSRPVDDMIRQLDQEIDRVIEDRDRQKRESHNKKPRS